MTRISTEHAVHSFSALHPVCATVAPGTSITFETSSKSYEALTPEAIDRGAVDFRQVNLLTGPVSIQDAMPGDALGVTIDTIIVEGIAYAPYIPKWRGRSFGIPTSILPQYRIRENTIDLSDTIRLDVTPMIGCFGVAPTRGEVSSLSPAAPTGGNLDLVEAGPGTTIWLPVMVPGALFALGDLHARMGRGEPAGVGLECGGNATVRFSIRKATMIRTPILETAERISFVGTHPSDHSAAEQIAVSEAYRWLKSQDDLDDELAFGITAALLDINFGGPAGANVVASFSKIDLARAGLSLDSARADSI